MIVGTVRETKIEEYRVALTPSGASNLVRAGHTVLVEHDAGAGSSYTDAEYHAAGAEIIDDPRAIFGRAELLLKVKELEPPEYTLLRPGQVLFTYLHLAADPEVADAILASGCIAIAYETVRTADGAHPLLAPMSEIAGRIAVEEAAHYLKRPGAGRGVLLSGIAGVPPAHVVVIGSGNVGANAARVAVALGARVTVAGIEVDQLRDLDHRYEGRVETVISSPRALEELVHDADVLIGAVLVEGDRAPIVVTREMVAGMRPGAVIVDVAVDQGGCIETTRPTDHANPTYVEEGVVHYAVTNMPGSVPQTASRILSALTLPYALSIANLGVEAAVRRDPSLAHGVNAWHGQVTHPAVAAALGRPYVPLDEAMARTRA